VIHLLNRKELITLQSNQRLYALQSALSAAGVEYRVKHGLSVWTSGRYHGTPAIQSDAANPCVIYVKASDYDRAVAAIQPALRQK